jgi:hypothetical protein
VAVVVVEAITLHLLTAVVVLVVVETVVLMVQTLLLGQQTLVLAVVVDTAKPMVRVGLVALDLLFSGTQTQ